MSNNIKIHSAINDEIADTLKEIAKTKGLDVIDYDNAYRVYKVAIKKNSSVEVTDKRCVGAGDVCLIGDGSFVSLYVASIREWFRTSPILSCGKKGKSIIIETENSFYELKGES